MPSKGESDALPHAPWGIISIKAQDEDHETPMQVHMKTYTSSSLTHRVNTTIAVCLCADVCLLSYTDLSLFVSQQSGPRMPLQHTLIVLCCICNLQWADHLCCLREHSA